MSRLVCENCGNGGPFVRFTVQRRQDVVDERGQVMGGETQPARQFEDGADTEHRCPNCDTFEVEWHPDAEAYAIREYRGRRRLDAARAGQLSAYDFEDDPDEQDEPEEVPW